MFYAWQCVSLVMALSKTSVDFVIKDDTDLICLLHVLKHGLSEEKNYKCQAKKPTSCISM